MNNVVKSILGSSLAALLAVACASPDRQTSSVANSSESLKIKSYAGSEAGFHVTSHLIMGPTEAVLVDAQFTRSEASKLSNMIKSSGKTLTTVFVTHGHPDHYLGIETLKKHFPKARYVASADTVEEIKKTGPEKIKQWKPMYKDDLADKIPDVEVLEGNLEVDGQELEVLNLAHGESETANIVFVPQLKTVVAGDALYDQVHFWLAEGRPQGVIENIQTIARIKDAEFFLAGHSLTGASGDSALIKENLKYVRSFIDATATSKTAEELASKIKAQFPKYALPVIADFSAQAAMSQK